MAIASRQLRRPAPDGFTVEDLWAMPEDGLRYELLDGMLIVNPPPLPRHELVVSRLHRLLLIGAPAGVEVWSGRLGWWPNPQRWFEPDLVVAPPPEDLDGRGLLHPPLLIIEVASQSTRHVDRTLKLAAYDEGGVGAYWIVDPCADAPGIDIFERPEPASPLQLVAHASGDEVASASHPWPVDVVPAALVH